MANASEVTVSTTAGGKASVFRFPTLLAERARELLQPAINFLEGLGAGGKEPLQRHAEIRFEHILLPALAIVGCALFGAGNGIAALVLREVHGGVGHLNQFLRS